VLGEIGMDTLRNGQEAQARFLAGHVREAALTGLAGTFVFSWTDEWHTGGHLIRDWAFGVTTAGRAPKPALAALAAVHAARPAELLPSTPRVSVVVCTYNGGRTLRQCLESLGSLDYPDYEVIVVDDGSTDGTREVLGDFPWVRAIHQPNLGLSCARNVGLGVATGEVIAYTDSDCFADADWLTHLVDRLCRTDDAGVGGPNLTPDDGRLAACVAAAPGQPTHVLEDDEVAEHIPGCNMAFRRGALEAINGFDPQYRKAGDDVDVCWRLQDAGYRITFSPAAVVWHHRRQGPRAYLRQQAGYGEAEALLRSKHPERFNPRGEGKWRGVMYGNSLQGLTLNGAIIYRGVFATGMFQCVYQPGPAHWAMLPVALEWHAAAAAALAAGFVWAPAWGLAGAMAALSLAVAGLLAWQARLPARYDGPAARLVVAALCLAQPVVRSSSRYRVRLLSRGPRAYQPLADGGRGSRLGPARELTAAYWDEGRTDRVGLLRALVAELDKRRCGRALDTGWSDWDIELPCGPFVGIRVVTAQEEHGGGRRLIRVRYRSAPTALAVVCAAPALAATAAAALARPGLAAAALAALLVARAVHRRRAARLVSGMVDVADRVAAGLGLVRLHAADLDSPAPDARDNARLEADTDAAADRPPGGLARRLGGRVFGGGPGSGGAILGAESAQ
jgi:GT2 family glycosyltransferase